MESSRVYAGINKASLGVIFISAVSLIASRFIDIYFLKFIPLFIAGIFLSLGEMGIMLVVNPHAKGWMRYFDWFVAICILVLGVIALILL